MRTMGYKTTVVHLTIPFFNIHGNLNFALVLHLPFNLLPLVCILIYGSFFTILIFNEQVNFSEDALRENIAAFVNALLLAKPVGLKKSKQSKYPVYFFCKNFEVVFRSFSNGAASKYAGYLNSFALCSTVSVYATTDE